MDIYKTRVGAGITDEERSQLIFKEIQNLHNDVKKKSFKTSWKSKIFSWLNTALSLSIIGSAAAIVIITALNNVQIISVIILGGVIFAISGINELLKLGEKGYYYKQGTYRLRRLSQQIINLTLTFGNFTVEEILTLVNSMRIQFDDIDLELYKASMVGEAKFGNSLRIIEHNDTPPSSPVSLNRSSPLSLNSQEAKQTPSHIHIHLDTPTSSAGNSPKETRKHSSRDSDSFNVSPYSTPVPSPIIPRKKLNSRRYSDTVIEIEESIM